MVIEIIDSIGEPVDAEFKVERDHIKLEISGKGCEYILEKDQEDGSEKGDHEENQKQKQTGVMKGDVCGILAAAALSL